MYFTENRYDRSIEWMIRLKNQSFYDIVNNKFRRQD